ncbi:MAG: RNA polymerase sigma factor [Bacteroidia bacterium]|nr:RNA polymerase sigma factor [Bacteroidia bacterium]
MSATSGNIEEDKDLVRDCLNGRREAQETFFNRYKSRMMALCVRYMGDREQAADVFQEAFIKAFRLLKNWRADGPLEAWLRRIMVHTALNELRKRKMIWIEDMKDGFVLHPLFNTAIAQLSEKELLALVAGLPKGYRTVFNLYVVEGYDHKEIAGLLGISDNTSRSQLMKARMLLQKMILEQDAIKSEYPSNVQS